MGGKQFMKKHAKKTVVKSSREKSEKIEISVTVLSCNMLLTNVAFQRLRVENYSVP